MHKHVDLAIADIQSCPYPGLKRGSSTKLAHTDQIRLLGFPSYAAGKQLHVDFGRITSTQVRSNVEYLLLSTLVVAGNSGGPVLNAKNEVVGVAVSGSRSMTEPHNAPFGHGALRIENLDKLQPIK